MPLLPWSRRPSPFEGYVEPALPADLPPTEAERTEVMVLGGTPSPHTPYVDLRCSGTRSRYCLGCRLM